MKIKLLISFICFYTGVSFSETFYVSNLHDRLGRTRILPERIPAVLSSTKIKADSVLFKRGERFFIKNDITKNMQNNIYFGDYGEPSLPAPILDGSLYHFRFDAKEWSDHEIINGIKFYKKKIKGLEQVENVYAGIEPMVLAREPDDNETVITGEKNSYTGFYRIDSVDVKNDKCVFLDKSNRKNWTGAEVVTKTRQWTYEKRIVNNTGSRFETDENTVHPIQKGWGYFIRRHFDALDSVNEWFFDEAEGILYFLPVSDNCTVYVSGNADEMNSGFDLKYKKNITIENLSFFNYKFGVKLVGSQDIVVRGCFFRNCIYGVMNKTTYLERIEVSGNEFRNMMSYGIRLLANNCNIEKNDIDSVGLSMYSESRGFDNLNGIEIYGKNNIITKNRISNVGYCAVRIYNCPGTKVVRNEIQNTNLTVADGGAIYSYHSMNGNKLIRGNTVKNAYGNVNGTTGDKDHACGIYLDELSLHFRVDSNYVSNCGDGIYIQNSRSDTVMYNYTENNRKNELHINHAGSILNGGKLNMRNDPDFDPEKLDSIPKDYYWDNKEQLMYYKNKNNGVVYLRPGNNLISSNTFIPGRNRYTFGFRTWRHINDDAVYELTGNNDFFRDNVPEEKLQDASFQIVGGNVKDFYQNGKNFDNLKSVFDKTKYDYLKSPPHIYIGRGRKYQVEK